MCKVLITYFSGRGATRKVAEKMAEENGYDLFEIKPVEPYTPKDLDYMSSKSRSYIEMHDKTSRPPILESCDVSKYDIVAIGFPIWWYSVPTIINTFIESVDLEGKIVKPFCTSGGTEIDGCLEELRQTYPELNFAKGLRFKRKVSMAKKWIEGDKKVVVISSSPRKGQNSDTVCDEFLRGAIDAGHNARKYFLENIEFSSCKACYACKTPEMKCVQDDGIASILEDMLQADVIVYATPVYYFEMCGTLKMFFDRCYPIFRHLKNVDYYIVLAAGSDCGDALTGLESFINFSINPDIKEVFEVLGNVKSQKSLLKKAYEAGKNC